MVNADACVAELWKRAIVTENAQNSLDVCIRHELHRGDDSFEDATDRDCKNEMSDPVAHIEIGRCFFLSCSSALTHGHSES